MLAGCGGSQPPIGAPGAMPQTSAIALGVPRRKNLLYATAPSEMGYILTYPNGKQVGFTSGNAYQYGLCADAKGQVFLSGYIPLSHYGILARYLHGSHAPGKTLFVRSVSFESCSINPVTGSIAATTLFQDNNRWKVAVFQDVNGGPAYYTVPKITPLAYCGYDDKGDLFVDGGSTSGFELAELPNGGKSFKDITLSEGLKSPGNIQWADGSLTIEDLSAARIDRVNVSGSTGTITGRTVLRGAQHQLFQSWIQGSTVIAAFGAQGSELGFWKYPDGGKPAKTLSNLGQINGVAVSLAQK
jgi:hypothetical protein